MLYAALMILLKSEYHKETEAQTCLLMEWADSLSYHVAVEYCK